MGNTVFEIPNFLGGINKGVDYSLIAKNEAQDAQNCNIDKGVLSVTNGYTPYSLPALPNGANLVTLIPYYKSGSVIFIAAGGGSLYKYDGTNWVLIASGFHSDYWDSVNNNVDTVDVIILSNTVDNIKVYDGTLLRDLKHDGKASAASSTNVAEKGLIDLHYERLWIAQPTALYASTVNKDGFDIEDFTCPVDPPEQVNMHGLVINLYQPSGSRLVGFKVAFDDILLFFEDSVQKIFGSSPENYAKVQVFSARGSIADRSIVSTEKGVFSVSRDGIAFYDGANMTVISKKVEELFLNMNISAAKNIVATYWNHKYICAIPSANSNTNDLIIEFDTDNKNFMVKRGFSVTSFVTVGDKLLFTGTDSRVYEYGNGATFNGSSINAYWETGYSDLGFPEATKEYYSLYFTGYGTGTVRFTISTDENSEVVNVPLSLSERVYQVDVFISGRLSKVRIESVNGSVFTVKNVRLLMELDVD